MRPYAWPPVTTSRLRVSAGSRLGLRPDRAHTLLNELFARALSLGADSVVPMVSVPLAYFESTVSATVDKMIRKPTKGMLGTKLRAPPPILTVKEVINDASLHGAWLPRDGRDGGHRAGGR